MHRMRICVSIAATTSAGTPAPAERRRRIRAPESVLDRSVRGAPRPYRLTGDLPDDHGPAILEIEREVSRFDVAIDRRSELRRHALVHGVGKQRSVGLQAISDAVVSRTVAGPFPEDERLLRPSRTRRQQHSHGDRDDLPHLVVSVRALRLRVSFERPTHFIASARTLAT